jgi:hypothetical protein
MCGCAFDNLSFWGGTIAGRRRCLKGPSFATLNVQIRASSRASSTNARTEVDMNKIVLVAVAIAFSATSLIAANFYGSVPPPSPPPVVAEEGTAVAPPPPSCRAAVVSGLVIGPWIELLAVRTGPGVQHPILDRLGNGYPLQVCAREGEWFAIVEADCPVNVMTWEGSPCTMGWSYRTWIIPVPSPVAPASSVIIPQG